MSDKRKHWIGFDLGGTKMLAKVFDSDFKEVASAKRKTEGHRGQKTGLARIAKTIEEVLVAANLTPADLAGIGVGCPGPVNPEKGVILEAPNLGWKNVPIARELESLFKCPAVACNDVDAGVYGEYSFGAAKGARCAIGVFPGTGIGGGAVIHGRLLEGARISCMEIGHMALQPNPGSGGETLETLASRLAIAASAAKAAYRGQAPWLQEKCGPSLDKITSGKLAESIAAGDKAVEQIVRQAADLLGCGIANLVHVLAPDIIVLGGGLVDAMPKLYLQEVTRSAEKRVLSAFVGTFQIVQARLGDTAGAQGAAAWARKKIEG